MGFQKIAAVQASKLRYTCDQLTKRINEGWERGGSGEGAGWERGGSGMGGGRRASENKY